MSGILDAIMFALTPSNGGLNATNYPNPFGLRAYPDGRGGYGGEMMPKGVGWAGMLKNSQGDTVTEYSAGDESGEFPLVYKGITAPDIASVLKASASGGTVPLPLYKRAREAADERRFLGLSPFKDVFDK